MRGGEDESWYSALYDEKIFSDVVGAFCQQIRADRFRVVAQTISNTLLSCADCAHWDRHVEQLLLLVPSCDLPSFSEQALLNTLFAWAVLTCVAKEARASHQQLQQLGHVAGALFKEANTRGERFVNSGDLVQIRWAHLYAELLGMPGLAPGALLQKLASVGPANASHKVRRSQKEVATVLRQMRCTVQLEQLSSDGVMPVDMIITALPFGTPCSIAVEFDGPHHYIAAHSGSKGVVYRLNGPTRLRNALERARCRDGLVCIPWFEWEPARDSEQAQEYLKKRLPLLAGLNEGQRTVRWHGEKIMFSGHVHQQPPCCNVC
jgi:hypothetical protein